MKNPHSPRRRFDGNRRYRFYRELEKANIIGARHMTFHTGVYSKFKKSGEKTKPFYAEHYETVLYENLKTLIKSSGDVLVCVENDNT